MNSPIERFISAHEHYRQLDRLRAGCRSPEEREVMHIQILQAYLDVQYQAMVIRAAVLGWDGIRARQLAPE